MSLIERWPFAGIRRNRILRRAEGMFHCPSISPRIGSLPEREVVSVIVVERRHPTPRPGANLHRFVRVL